MKAGRRRYTQDEPPPDNWAPTQAVSDPIINRAYEEPSQHWSYKDGEPFEVPGRRPAMYWYKSRRVAGGQTDVFAEEERDELPLVNRLRADVGRWRASGYRGASKVTRDLFAQWRRNDLARPLFFCQLEAAETLIYLLEIAIPGRLTSTRFRNFQVGPEDFRDLFGGVGAPAGWEDVSQEFFPRLVDQPADATLLPLRRFGCKMATGSGKTIVMAMIAVWAFCNRGRNPASERYPSGILVCAPNVTVRQRLQVLDPGNPKNYYDDFDLVPARYRTLLGAGRVLVVNWHRFLPKNPHNDGGVSYRVVDKGEETAESFTLDRLAEFKGRFPILVFNDEGHHCWRPHPSKTAEEWEKDALAGLTGEEKAALRGEGEEAKVWLTGLDKVNNSELLPSGAPCVSAAIDLSATPFYLSNSGYPEGSPFPWLVSDFGLVDAIECGIVKIPRLPVRDDLGKKDDAGRPDPKYYRLWEHIKSAMQPVDKIGTRMKTESIYREAQSALVTLAAQWKAQFDAAASRSPGGNPIPPVMTVVCDSTKTAKLVFERISGEKEVAVPRPSGKGTELQTVYGSSAVLPELSNSESQQRTVRIDSKLLATLDVPGKNQDAAAQALRELIDTVGQKGEPGEKVRCVVSVSMLTEGWSANNVTHILGIRAFGSQLLCEQVVGRGLRRMSYRRHPETGMLPPRYVDVYGIPFSLIPFKGRSEKKDGPDPVYHQVFAVPEKEEEFEIRAPVVESYTYGLRSSGIRCDVDALEGLVVDDEPSRVYLVPTRGYYDDPTPLSGDDFVEQNREEYHRSFRVQQILFRIAHLIVDDLVAGSVERDDGRHTLWARHLVFPEVLRICRDYLDRRVTFARDVDRREIGLQKYAQLFRERVRDGIQPAAASSAAPFLPVLNSFQSFVSTKDVNYQTTLPVVPLVKSHLNLGSWRSKWEADTMEMLEDFDFVEAFAPNDQHVGLTVPYEYQQQRHVYVPDFVVRLRNEKMVLLEIKGRGGEIRAPDQVLAKNAAARKWVAAVNNNGRFGTWEFEICRDLAKLRGALAKHVEGATVLPFRFVDPQMGEHFRTCVPLMSLRAAAGQWSEEQTSLDPAEWSEEWVTWEGAPEFSGGMFVARVHGASMEPLIPSGAHCLFRPTPAGSRQGRHLLVWHQGVADPETGGEFTVKVFTSRKTARPDGGWEHVRVVLKPLNPEFDPIVLTQDDEAAVRVIAELAAVISAGSP